MAKRKPIDFRNVGKIAREVRRQISKHNLCFHAVEQRAYASTVERDLDATPSEVCKKCGRKKLIQAFIFSGGILNDLPDDIKRGFCNLTTMKSVDKGQEV